MTMFVTRELYIITIFYLLNFGVTGICTQDFVLARQVLYLWAMPPVPFAFSYFSDRVLGFGLRQALHHDLSTYTSHISRITDVHHHTWLVCGNGILLTFLPKQASKHDPPDLHFPSSWD
jgi:hypothetical protein